jgi:hypothetical protein
MSIGKAWRCQMTCITRLRHGRILDLYHLSNSALHTSHTSRDPRPVAFEIGASSGALGLAGFVGVEKPASALNMGRCRVALL